jgi:hypothetical protein
MTNTETTYTIMNYGSGALLGEWAAESPEQAYEDMLRDAGCDDSTVDASIERLVQVCQGEWRQRESMIRIVEGKIED